MKLLFAIVAAPLLAAFILATQHVLGQQAHAANPVVARPLPAPPVPAPLESAAGTAPEDTSEIIGIAEPLLVGTPSPRRETPKRASRR